MKPLLASLAMCLLFSCGCARLLTRPITALPASWPHEAPWGLNRALLQPEPNGKIVFIVSVKAGVPYRNAAFDRLIEIAAKYSEVPVHRDTLESFDLEVVQGTPDRLRCNGVPLPESVEFVLVEFVGSPSSWLGETVFLPADEACGRDSIPLIRIAQDRLKKFNFLWLTRNDLETVALLHEYGHLLGLGSNPTHGYLPNYPSIQSGVHCTRPDCPMTLSHPRALVFGFWRYGLTFRSVRDYCPRCVADIVAAKSYWTTGRRLPPSPRLLPRGLIKWAKKLEDRDFRDGGRAQLLLSYGKHAVAPLIGRITETGNELAREFCQRLIKHVLVREATRIQGQRFVYAAADQSDDLVLWWEVERPRFLAGDEWLIPKGIISPASSEPADRAFERRE